MLGLINSNIKDIQRSVNSAWHEQAKDRGKLNNRLDKIEGTLEEILNKLDTDKETSKTEKGK